MDDIKKDPFEEYIRQSEPSKRELGYAWYTAMGLQAVDGLDTSDYLKNIAKQNIEGEITLSEAGRLIESYYEESKERDADRTKEADIVSARIAAILSERRLLFQCLSISEFTEGCLKESTPMLEYDIRTENEYEYPLNSISDIIPHLARFVSRLWQIHAFGEGNTRTTAVFFIKYLRSMGFDVTTEYLELFWLNP